MVNQWGVKCLLVCKIGATLSDYWDCDTICGKYSKASTTPFTKSLFETSIHTMLCDLANETSSLPVIGLLYGYPVEETLKLFT